MYQDSCSVIFYQYKINVLEKVVKNNSKLKGLLEILLQVSTNSSLLSASLKAPQSRSLGCYYNTTGFFNAKFHT